MGCSNFDSAQLGLWLLWEKLVLSVLVLDEVQMATKYQSGVLLQGSELLLWETIARC